MWPHFGCDLVEQLSRSYSRWLVCLLETNLLTKLWSLKWSVADVDAHKWYSDAAAAAGYDDGHYDGYDDGQIEAIHWMSPVTDLLGRRRRHRQFHLTCTVLC